MSAGAVETTAPALELRGITKRFGAITALDGVSTSVGGGSVHALLGENGAGKSTLMRVAFGLTPADAGEVRLFGQVSAPHSVRSATNAGVGMVHQHLSLAPNLTASENLVLGGRGVFRPWEAVSLLERTAAEAGLDAPPDVATRDLSIVEQQRLEILKALARNAKVLILDEPTAVLAPSEADDLLRWVRSFADRGGSVVLVTHKLREALAVADRITILRRAHVTFDGVASGQSEAELARAILPEPLELAPRRASISPGEVVAEAVTIDVSGARGSRRIRGASFALRRNEIVGVAAVEGSGHHELLAALAGLTRTSAGVLRLPPRTALIPADRAREALIPDFTLAENVALRDLGKRRGLMPWREIANLASSLMRIFDIRAQSARTLARTLSGGNQQRLVVARELDGNVDLVVADNPTRGLDIRASAFVLDQLCLVAAAGAAVVVHSSDIDEMLSIATRMLVVFHGDVRETSLTHDAIGRAMLGASTLDAMDTA